MCKKDKSEKYLEDYPEVFADIYNVLVFKKQLLHPERLVTGPTESVYKAENGDLAEQRRDTAKYHMEQGVVTAQFGIENQSRIDKDMPIRISSYDVASYQEQIKTGLARYPVKTIVLNFSDRKWETPLTLSDVIPSGNLSEKFMGYFQDYGIDVYDIAFLPEKIRKQFISDFRVVADFFAGNRDGEYIPSSDEICHVEAVLHFFKVFMKDERFEAMVDTMNQKQREGECINMCTILDQYIELGKEQGLEQGLEQGIEQGLEQGIEQGMEQGLRQGKAEGWRQVAEVAELLKNGISISELISMDYPEELIDIAVSII